MSDDAEQDDKQDDKQRLTGHDVEAEQLEDWRVMFGALHARFRTGGFAKGLALVNEIGAAAEGMNHHPDLDLSYPLLDVRLSSHDVGGITRRDIRLARQISESAGRLGAEPDPGAVSVVEIALDTPDVDEIKPFWAAVLGYEPSDDDEVELRDPDGTRPTLWFQRTEHRATEPPEQRFHLDIRVPPDVAERRVRAALEAGGTLVGDERAPSVWVLSDAQGNKACVTTWLGREA